MKKISINQNDLKIINDIVKENNVQTFVLKQLYKLKLKKLMKMKNN